MSDLSKLVARLLLLPTFIIAFGVMLKGSSAVISASTRGQLSGEAAIFLMTIIFVLYGVAGGLAAAILTDFIQGVLTIVFSYFQERLEKRMARSDR